MPHTNYQETTGEQLAHPELVTPDIDPDYYLQTVFSLYRQDRADYRGQRNEDQKLIAEYSSAEADEYFDQQILGVMALREMLSPGAPKEIFVAPDSEEEATITLGGLSEGASLKDMRNSWRQQWVGMNILTNRLHRDSSEFRDAQLTELFEMPEANKKKLIDSLFGNFQDLNALRFGARGSGIRRRAWANDPDSMEPVQTTVDADIARNPRVLAGNALRRGYQARGRKNHEQRHSIHAAGKMTPHEFKELRRTYPEVDMDVFAQDASFFKDMAAQYEKNH